MLTGLPVELHAIPEKRVTDAQAMCSTASPYSSVAMRSPSSHTIT